MDAELNVGTAGLDANLANHIDSRVAHGLVFAVGESLRRSDSDGVAGVYTHGVKVFDGADNDDVVRHVAHHFQFEFFPSQNRLFDQSFVDRREVETACQQLHQLFTVVGDAAARAAERKRRANDDRKADFAGKFQTIFNVVHQGRLGNVKADLLHGVFEDQPVFSLLDGSDVGADELDVVLIENAAVGEFNSKIQRGLATNGRQNGEACAGRHLALDADDFFHVLACKRLNIGAVRRLRIGHDGRRI